MLPSSFEHETIWAIVGGLVFAVIFGGFGGWLLLRAACQWSAQRIRSLRTSIHTIRAMMAESAEAARAAEPLGSISLDSPERAHSAD